MAFTMDAKLKELLADEGASAILDDMVPGITKDKRLKLAANMKIKDCVKYPQAGFTKEMAEELERRLAAL